jgi:hypothetical protein
MLRHLKQSATIAAIVACVLSIVFWMRSQTWEDTIYYVPPDMSHVHRADGMVGRVIISFSGRLSPVFESGLVVSGRPQDLEHQGADYLGGFFGLALSLEAGGLHISLPYWFLTLLTAAVAIVPNAKHLRHFTLKHLFAASTIVAVTLGLGILATKSTSEFMWLIW